MIFEYIIHVDMVARFNRLVTPFKKAGIQKFDIETLPIIRYPTIE
jgi:hypothetical protein